MCQQLVIRLFQLLLSQSISMFLERCPHPGDELAGKQAGFAWLICSEFHLPTTTLCGFCLFFSSTAKVPVALIHMLRKVAGAYLVLELLFGVNRALPSHF